MIIRCVRCVCLRRSSERYVWKLRTYTRYMLGLDRRHAARYVIIPFPSNFPCVIVSQNTVGQLNYDTLLS